MLEHDFRRDHTGVRAVRAACEPETVLEHNFRRATAGSCCVRRALAASGEFWLECGAREYSRAGTWAGAQEATTW